MKEKRKPARFNWKQIALLQMIVFVYSFISMLSKCVSMQIKLHGLFSIQVLGGLAGFFCALAVYAFFWQKILKKVELSVAYANKAVGLLWTLVWAGLLFGEAVTIRNVVGLLVICAGVMMVTENE